MSALLRGFTAPNVAAMGLGPPAAPTNPAAVAGVISVSVSWTASAGATSYNLYRSTTSGAETLYQTGVTSPYSDTSVTDGVTYYYKVSAVGPGGESSLSSEASAKFWGLTESLISYWKLEEASGSRADSFGTNTLTDNNTVTQQTGKLGSCAQFTSLNTEYLSRADNASLRINESSFTLSAWIYADTISVFPAILCKNASGNPDSRDEFASYINSVNNKLTFYVVYDTNVSKGIESSETLSTGTWYHIILWRDATGLTLNIKINNGTATTVAITGVTATNANTQPFVIGTYGSTQLPFNGRIDSVGFWKRVLTAAEHTALYNSGSGRAITGTEP